MPLDATLVAAILALAGGLIGLSVQQYFDSRRQKQRLEEDRRLRIRDDRRALYRDVIELSYSIFNNLNRAANYAFIREIADEEGFLVNEEIESRAQEEVGALTSEINPKIDVLQARIREVEIMGGDAPARAARRIHSSINELWSGFPTVLGRPVDRKRFLQMIDDAEGHTRSFVEEIRAQIVL